MRKEIEAKAYAKLNISLDILARNEDGYHDMRMVMQSVQLCDKLRISVTDGGGVGVSTNLSYLPDDGRNIAVKAAKLFFEAMDVHNPGIVISLEKHIPVCAGLGGGSSDAAAVLRALNRLFDTGLSLRELEKMSEGLGSDVPFCVAGGTVLAEGRGERLCTLKPIPECAVVICKPEFSISTPSLFAQIDLKKITNRPDTEGIIDALSDSDLPRLARRMYNVFEDVLPPKYAAEVATIKSRLIGSGALGTVMSGTGSAVFGIFGDDREARAAYKELRPDYSECFLTRTIGSDRIVRV